MRFMTETVRHGVMLRVFGGRPFQKEVFYTILGLSGLQFEVELPTQWHETKTGWLRVSVGFLKVAVAFPWPKTYPDYMQCSGPTFGFTFFDDALHLHWGQGKGTRDDPIKLVKMPWQWRHREHKILSEKQTHSYEYHLRSGEIQRRQATIQVESRLWTRPWYPWRLHKRMIDINFSDEVGERSGSWKGGCTGCSYDMLPHESPLTTLRRMERERKF